jgi:hypothetical protein
VKRLLAIALLTTGCASLPAEPLPLTGDWAGTHVALHLAPSGGTLDYDCAHGTIGPFRVLGNGSFTADGTHTPEHGGPAREGEVLPSYPTQYSGTVRGDRMTLQGRTSNGFDLGPFELRRGAQPQLKRCL